MISELQVNLIGVIMVGCPRQAPPGARVGTKEFEIFGPLPGEDVVLKDIFAPAKDCAAADVVEMIVRIYDIADRQVQTLRSQRAILQVPRPNVSTTATPVLPN